MSKTFPKKSLFIDKNVFTTTIIPSNNKDEIIGLAKAGEFGKLEQLLLNMPVKTIFEDTILHTIIKSDMTPIQKETIISLLLKKGVPINKLDDTGLPPIYYAVNQQLDTVTKLLIDKKANLNIKLPNGFDLFQTALMPSIKECPAQLINIKDQVDIGRVESQMLDTEREFRKVILGLPDSLNMIKDVLNFLEKYPEFSIKYIDLSKKDDAGNPEPTIENIRDINILDQETKQYFPMFKNDVHFKLKSLGTDLIKFVTPYNESQINEFINTGISTINNEFNSTLKTNLLSTDFPKINDIYQINGVPDYDYNTIYNNLFDFEGYNIDKIEAKLNSELDEFIETIYQNYDKFNTDILEKIDEINNILIIPASAARAAVPPRGARPGIPAIIPGPKYKSINALILPLDTPINFDDNTIINFANIVALQYNYRGFIGGRPGDVMINVGLTDIKDNHIETIHTNITPNDSIQKKLINIRRLLYYYTISLKTILYIIENLPIYEYYSNDFNDTDMPNNIKKDMNKKFDELMQILLNDANPIKDIKKFNEYVIKINNISNIFKLNHKYNLPNPPKLLFNNNFLLFKPNELEVDINNNTNNINEIGLYGDVNLNYKLYNQNPPAIPLPNIIDPILPPEPVAFKYQITNFIESNDDVDDFPYINNLIIPDEYNHLKIMLMVFHKKIFTEITQTNTASYIEIRNKLQTNNSLINPDIIEKLTLSSLNNAIVNTFREIVNLAINNTSEILVGKELQKLDNGVDNAKFLENLQKRLNKKDIKRIGNNNYYLDENYSNGEPIDMIPCLNNNVKLIKLLRKKIHVNVREYQYLIFKLGIPDLLDSDINNNKIGKVDLVEYFKKHKIKLITDITYLNNELKEKLTRNNLDFFNVGNSNIYINDPDKELPESKKFKKEIYDSLTNDQIVANKYLTDKLKLQLDNLFTNIIKPKVEEYLKFFVDTPLNNINPIIPSLNIINEYLQINPKQIKESPRSLDTIVDEFSKLYLDNVASTPQKNISSLYNEKFKPKLIKFLEHMSQYYLNVYRNHLRYIFNKYRYEQLLNKFR